MPKKSTPEKVGPVANELIELLLRKAPDQVKNSERFQEFKAAVQEAEREGESPDERFSRLKRLWAELYG